MRAALRTALLLLLALAAATAKHPGPGKSTLFAAEEYPGDGSPPRGGAGVLRLRETALCSALDPSLLVYNRVPKAGSTTMLSFVKRMQKSKKSFTYLHSYDWDEVTSEQYVDYLAGLQRREERVVFDKHMFFLESLSAEGTTWMNVMRDPVSRVVSNYYFFRFSDERPLRKRNAFIAEFGNASIDECVARPPEQWLRCGLRTNFMSRFFCGTHPDCDMDAATTPQEQRERAFERATRNIREHFAVVGTIERLDDTLQLLSRRLPRHFRGVRREAEKRARRKHGSSTVRNANAHPDPSAETVRRLREALDVDYRLYAWVNERMDQQLAACNSS